eukprot:TRINITY_DN3597_c0_g1_i1.p1 TRINITY_DN3597_c0_g1~~TRINITY_DN3597_c0_g1_i1.p1  ORF type:complete len:207 (-),score=28.50 TRINITY_DN3597_c0_g1_i1:5-625(-)
MRRCFSFYMNNLGTNCQSVQQRCQTFIFCKAFLFQFIFSSQILRKRPENMRFSTVSLLVVFFCFVSVCFGAPSNCKPAGLVEGSLESEVGDGFIILTWQPAPSRRCIDKYQVGVFLSDEGDVQLLKNLDVNTSDARGVVVGELQNNLNYMFVVTAFNQFGSGLATVEASPGGGLPPTVEENVVMYFQHNGSASEFRKLSRNCQAEA